MDAWDKHMKYKSNVFDYTDFGIYVISEPQYGAGEKGLDEFTGIRYIRITDINEDGTLNEEIISAAKSEDKYKLKENDFLIARSGNTVGKTYLYKNSDGPAIYAGYLVRYELDNKKVIPEYMLFYTKSFLFKSWIESAQRISGQPNINGQEYLLASVIVPSIEIQQRIVEKATKLRDQALKIKNDYKTSLEKAKDDFANKIFAF
jgi:restriction endonuclease S subunit